MATFTQLLNRNRIVYVGFQGQKIALEYDSQGYDDPIYTESIKLSHLAEDNPRRLRINNRILERMLTAWDLSDEPCSESCEDRKEATDDPICREHSVPVTAERIAALPNILRGNMVTRIMEDARSGADDDPKLNGSS